MSQCPNCGGICSRCGYDQLAEAVIRRGDRRDDRAKESKVNGQCSSSIE